MGLPGEPAILLELVIKLERKKKKEHNKVTLATNHKNLV